MKVACTLLLLSLFVSAHGLEGDTFTLNCAPLTAQRSDPVLSPGRVSNHVHTVVGGNGFNANMSEVNATATSCDKALDHSNYWMPQLYYHNNSQYILVKFQEAAIFYQKRACDYTPNLGACNQSFVPLAFPHGFRMVAGEPSRRAQNDSDLRQASIFITCTFNGGSTTHPGFPARPCNLIIAKVYFPSCWDGEHLSTPDQSHVAYPQVYNGGMCPKSHPVAIFSIYLEFTFSTSIFKDDFTHFVFSNGDTTGYGLHGGFV
jgi:hypothetical protein